MLRFHQSVPCTECGQGCATYATYERHLAEEHGFSKRKLHAAALRAKWRHSMCRDCWVRRYRKKSSVGHEVPQRCRVWETCCFCGKRHKDGIVSRTNPNNRDIICNSE
jgi:hypothetical protein